MAKTRAPSRRGNAQSHLTIVIPGRRASVEPGIHNHDREYGFRVRAAARPEMTEGSLALAMPVFGYLTSESAAAP